jgi:hypothetical protein
MKKILLSFFLSFIFFKSNAQITFDTTITPLDGLGWDFYTVQISSTETKYLFEDTVTNTFSLYNMDFTPFMTNIAVPQPFESFTFQVLYVTRSLFDCDTSNIEYAYATTSGGTKPFYIMRADGTQLFQLDSAFGIFCLGGCLGLSDIIKPIRNTSAGAKLFLHKGIANIDVHIYSLCGTLPEEVFDFMNINQSFVKIFPNPSSSSLTFQINLPDNINEYELVIWDNNAKEIKREKVNLRNDKHFIDISSFSSGTYYYSLCTKTKAYQSGKFILTK